MSNYVYYSTLDATHMLLTCLKMKQHNITFASVHDSYWTHAADIEVMNKVSVIKLVSRWYIV